ncbi:P-loop containing nucleoside triphosphate hydrolase protein [Endogone sp. FLAS-F59071]|nr:P-loop containing nucleoside triphosphate hydrolase protein [Endogone sp. FLAS-F59071]|eukprot:RUS20781.1 P-loop containing nucleoside triphosphate hydrolase protein [Endogone sp. FLAS-F59071]
MCCGIPIRSFLLYFNTTPASGRASSDTTLPVRVSPTSPEPIVQINNGANADTSLPPISPSLSAAEANFNQQPQPAPINYIVMSAEEPKKIRQAVTVKVGMVGDAQIGKTSLMVKYIEGSFDQDYVQTLGVNFMEKTITIKDTAITFSVWDLGGQREFLNMLPLVCNDAVAILFMFDLTRKSTLNSVKEWYRQASGLNKSAIPFLIGTKYDEFENFSKEDKEEITKQVKCRYQFLAVIFCFPYS